MRGEAISATSRVFIAPLQVAAGCLLAGVATAGVAVQPGVYYHEPDGIALELSAIRSGEVCPEEDGDAGICSTGTQIVVTGRDSCQGNDGSEFPCTRYGYEFDYQGAEAGDTIDCNITRLDQYARESSLQYQRPLEANGGRIYLPMFRGYAPVEQRAILSEVHRCQYQGRQLVDFEYIIYYEPDTVPPAVAGTQPAEPLFPELPNACGAPHLTEPKARGLLGAERVKPSVANEHLPELQSQCIYSAKDEPPRQLGFVYKFMLADMFDVDELDPLQLQFNATFASGGAELIQTLDDLGDRAFVFLKGDRTTLLVITGIRGPNGPDGRPTAFIANYYLDHPGLSQERRTDLLIEQARLDLSVWSASSR